MRVSKLFVGVICCLLSSSVLSEVVDGLPIADRSINTGSVVVLDDVGNKVIVTEPVTRIISLAPHLTEILYSLGVGDLIVGTVKYSDYPEEAKEIPRLGDAFALNVEAVMAMDPDIIFAWQTGGVNASVDRLKDLGIPVFVNHSTNLKDISDGFTRIGKLVGKASNGLRLQSQFETKLRQIAPKNVVKNVHKPVVFFQISDQALYSISDKHIIGQSIRHCGGQNLFSNLQPNVTLVSKEAVIAGSPDLIILTQSPRNSLSQKPPPWLSRWQGYPSFKDRVALIDPGRISRPSYRMLEGLERICELIAVADRGR